MEIIGVKDNIKVIKVVNVNKEYYYLIPNKLEKKYNSILKKYKYGTEDFYKNLDKVFSQYSTKDYISLSQLSENN